MKYICDFHIHSKYSIATARNMDLESLVTWGKIKGVDLIGTGDFTHPVWFSELQSKLEEDGEGIYRIPTKSEDDHPRFLLTTEISCIYKQDGRVRKIHLIIFAPSLEVVEKINKKLGAVANITYDGRPIIGIAVQDLVEMVFSISKECFIVPAHAWTPWFSVFGSKSGFDSLEECFGPYTKYIKAIETGLSSDPAMNWRLSALDNITLISNSDAHSPSKIGREANVLELSELSYANVISLLSKDKNVKGSFLYTLEFFPEEGKYHYDGHRNCKISWHPKEAKKNNLICPVCKKEVTVGVVHRVEDLADRAEGFKPEGSVPFKSLVPLVEVVAEAEEKRPAAKVVQKLYDKLVTEAGNEFYILLDAPLDKIAKASNDKVADGIKRMREGKVKIEPGYDGEFGKISIFKRD
ncbi:MAG: endonuclease Q family protein [Candidatus Saganbacteria bacterium]|nr:endonuclease Q family protein [Candidatus Saganbacteria bacterium]